MSAFVLDTSAILTVLNGEEGLETVVSLLAQARNGEAIIYLPFMALMEMEYLTLRRASPEETQYLLTLVKAWPVQPIESGEEWRHLAAEVKARTPLSVADAWIAALALLYHAQLVHKDPEFEQVPELSALALPL
ncbi:MAG: PIN domain-containing protein [Anaerolineae bacterium]